MKLLIGPAAETEMFAFVLSLHISGLVCTGFAHPSNGIVVKTLISYGSSWYKWYMRRLAERPANVLFALRQIIG